MSDSTLQLKRKRESLGGQQKKVKKSRKSESIAEQDTEDVTTNGTSVAEPITAAHTSKQKSKDKPKSNTGKSQVNGTRDDAPIELPERKNKKKDKQAVDSKEKPQADATESKELVKADSPDSTRSQPKLKKRSKNAPKWSISPVQGGWFLPLDPVFSSDERYLLLATLKSLQVYATETSLLANTLPVGGTGVVITAYALSQTKSNQVYVADSTGLITLWDWADGKKLGRWDIGATVRNMAVVVQPGTDDDLVYCYEVSDGKHIVNVHALRTKEQASKTELKRVIKSTSAVHSFQILLQGKYVVIATIDSITIGKRLKTSKTAVQDFEYVWREFQFSKHITTFNTYFRPQQVTEKSKKSAQDQRDVLDLAVGDEIGVILLFEDILASFAALEKNQKSNPNKTDNAESLRPKRLHWHREAVGSVKWSLDGNYIISGGDETVLTIWQLATGKPQHLPHLTAAIENVVVSPTGTSYAVTLANNSVIVLSTTELDAKTNIIGIQSRRVDVEHMPRESTASQVYLKPFRRIPTAIDPKDGKLLISVPSSQPRLKAQGIQTQPYLQAFDVPNNRPIARQALTRNNATDPNMAPEGGKILEPDVKSLQVSYDGEWLVSVEEWLPPRADTGFLDEGIEEFNEHERLLRREVFLKFWRWNAKTEQWALEGRHDAPHFFEDAGGNARVLDMVSDPTAHGFATIGEDHIVRIWKPKSRLRDGIVVRGADNKGLVNWSLEHSIALPLDDSSDASSNVRQLKRISRLAWSADGSILTAASSVAGEDASTPIHLIDPSEGVVRQSITEIDTTGLSHVGIVDRHMVVVAHCVTVWDIIGHRPVYFAPIDTPGVAATERASVIRFAVNAQSGSFAISLPRFEKKEGSRSKKATSKVSVHNTIQAEPLWSHTLAGIILGLTADSEKGFVALDSNSCVRTISPNVTQALPTPPTDDRTETLLIEDVNGFEDIKEEGERREIRLDDEYDRLVVTQQDLEKIFHNGNTLPAPRDMFSAVLKLFGGVAEKAA